MDGHSQHRFPNGQELRAVCVWHHAGVGVGTTYRRFANKEELIDAILI